MQDRFKFRVWCENNQEWEKDTISISNKNMYEIRNDKFTKYTDIDPKNHIINFCTGLKDKNGKLIYEGDIVKLTNINDNEFVEIRQVIFKDCAFQFTLPNSTQVDRPLYCWAINYLNRYKHINLEILGNIYENTELLEVHHD